MIKKILSPVLLLVFVINGCTKQGPGTDTTTSGELQFLNNGITGSSSSAPGNSGNGLPGTGQQPGLITAGEWNDLENWAFMKSVAEKGVFDGLDEKWSFFNGNRVSVVVTDPSGRPLANVPVRLKNGNSIIYAARTDNFGRAELWSGLFQRSSHPDYAALTIDVNNGERIIARVTGYDDGDNRATLTGSTVDNRIEVSFVVDATGSMGDELEYLKTEMLDVISRVKRANPLSFVATSSVFYRDEGDEYVTKSSPFTDNAAVTAGFIKDQKADGGGDFPEAVHSALDQAVNNLQWSANARTRILFLVLDAPPHHTDDIIRSLQLTVMAASEKGIKIIPITASGINSETEFVMRAIAMSTNGTYVFITNDSGIGNDHLKPTVGKYDVEFLNNLMVRLINKYAQ